ncbi:MAG: ribosomal protein L7/L12 [Verrucomicrobiales bacterium]
MSKDHLSEEEKQNLINCIRSGQKIQAIKIYSEATGANLADSKHVIEALAVGISENMPPHSGTGDSEITALLTQGNKIAAIKLYREKTGVGLAEAKRKVEELAESLGGSNVPKKTLGCGASVVVSVAFATVGFAILWKLL